MHVLLAKGATTVDEISVPVTVDEVTGLGEMVIVAPLMLRAVKMLVPAAMPAAEVCCGALAVRTAS